MLALESVLDLPGLRNDLDRVEAALRSAVRSDDAFLTEVASHLLSAGGKRLRPALAVAVGHLSASPASDDVIQGAASVELVHLGSLYHDDVMDEAKTRRTVESVNSRWGNLVAILAGDFLLAKASEIAASLGTEVTALLASTIGSLCEGQVRELQTAFNTGRTEEAYFSAIAGKTASLMATSCRIGALAAGLPRPCVDALTAYGHDLGIAFQIVDDVLDVVATDEELGKPAGNDLVEGVYTLPVILALEERELGERLRDWLGRPLKRDEADEVRDLIRSNGAVSTACDRARMYAARAADHLDPIGGGQVSNALAGIGDLLVDNLPR
jgi:heptaprenyl diphosphate synthase